MKSKKEKALERLKSFEASLRCVICHEPMTLEGGRLQCSHHHTFDVAKQGYVYLFNGQPVNGYTASLFEARHRLIVERQLYAPVHEALVGWLSEQMDGTYRLLDAGCGEGSQLMQWLPRVKGVEAVGIDLAKDGIQQAAKRYDGALWFVNDLANTAFQSGTFDVILNMLSPANYEEFARLLTPNGYVIKIVPNAHYLRQIREAQYDERHERATYHNVDVVRRFRERFDCIVEKPMTYDVSLTEQQWQSLVQMTPLTWKTDGPLPYRSVVTIDLVLLIGRPRKRTSD